MVGLRGLFEAQRARLARLTAVGGAAVVALLLLPHVPRTVDVEFELGPTHREIIELRVAYVQAGEELHGLALSFPEGAPGRVKHSVSLPPGDFEVRAELRASHGGAARAAIGQLHTPADGPVRIRLEPAAGRRDDAAVLPAAGHGRAATAPDEP